MSLFVKKAIEVVEISLKDLLILVQAAKHNCAECSSGYWEAGWSDKEIDRQCKDCQYAALIRKIEKKHGEVDLLERITPETTVEDLLTPYEVKFKRRQRAR